MTSGRAVRIPGELIDLIEENEGAGDRIGLRLLDRYKEYLELQSLAVNIREGGECNGMTVSEVICDFVRHCDVQCTKLEQDVSEAMIMAQGLELYYKKVIAPGVKWERKNER